MEYTHVLHTFEPVYDESSKILILGSFPSVKSRQQQFYYGHKQNRFWKILTAIYGAENADLSLQSVEYKKKFLLDNHIALWDVIASCDIRGSSDTSIKNITVNDINRLVEAAPISKILLNGEKAYKLYERYFCNGASSSKCNSKYTLKCDTKYPSKNVAKYVSKCNSISLPPHVKMPSTSPANAAWTLDKLVAAWEKEIRDIMD